MTKELDDARHEDDALRYPPYVITEDQRMRWDLAEGIARQIFGDAGEAHVWQATRSIYHGPIATE